MSKAKYKKARSTISKLLSDLMDEWWWHDDDRRHGSSRHPINPASKLLTTTSPPAPQFNTVGWLISIINLREVSATTPHLEKRASSIISVGFTVYGVYGAVPPATLPAFTSADASSSSTKNCASSSATSATSPADSAAPAAHPHSSVCCLGFCCPGTERPAQSNPAQSRHSLWAQYPEHVHSFQPLRT